MSPLEWLEAKGACLVAAGVDDYEWWAVVLPGAYQHYPCWRGRSPSHAINRARRFAKQPDYYTATWPGDYVR